MAQDPLSTEYDAHLIRRAFRDGLPWITHLASEESGEDLVEYGLLTAFIGFAGVGVFSVIMATLHSGYLNWDSGTQGLWEMPPPQ